VSICRIINTSVLSIRKTWSESIIYGRWSNPNRAGGCVNFKSTFCDNPQYMFEINHDPEKPDEVLFNLDQLSLRSQGKSNHTIGFMIMKVEDNRKYRLHQSKPKTVSSTFIDARSVFLRHRLNNGRYIIIPSTFDPQIEGEFLLRVYSDENNNFK
jgi:calpain-5